MPFSFVDFLFKANQTSLSAKYDTFITPAGWTFSIWGVIYAWQALHLIYGLTFVCRKSTNEYLYIDPAPIGSVFYIFFMFSCVSNIAWIFTFDRQLLEAALVFLVLIALSLYGSIIASVRQLNLVGSNMTKKGLRKDIWAVRFIVHNGVALYCAWTNVASLLNLSIVLHYVSGVSQETCAWISIAILNVILVVVFVLEVFVFDQYVRYVFAHYVTLIVALSGILYQNYASDRGFMIYAIVMLVLSAIGGVTKVLIMIIKGCKQPIDYETWVEEDNSKVSYSAHRTYPQ